MFERYTELARRTVFFARYEASVFGSPYIETEHLLLGVLRENKSLGNPAWSSAEGESIRKQIESQVPERIKTNTSVDLPLSWESKQVLAYAAEESAALEHAYIDNGHLVLGLLRLENCAAAKILRQHEINYLSYREIVRLSPPSKYRPGLHLLPQKTRAVSRESTWNLPGQKQPGADSLLDPIVALEDLIDTAIQHFDSSSSPFSEQKLKRKPWTRKQALGHLVDLATTHHNLFARALTEARAEASGYPGDEWVTAQQYSSFAWLDLVDLWVTLNRLIVHVLSLIPEDKVNTPCRIGIDEPVTLMQLASGYVARCNDLLGQMLSRL